MSAQENVDVFLDGGIIDDVEEPQPRAEGPRMLIPPINPIPVRPYSDTQTQEISLDWADDKESEIAAKQRKARRKELKKQKLAESQSQPTTATKTMIAKSALKDRTAASASKKSGKALAKATASNAIIVGKKRKNSAVEDKGPKKRIASTNPISASSGNVKTVPPVKRNDMSQEQRTAMNKAKREVQKKKRRENKAAEKHPVKEAEGDEADAAAKVAKTKELSEYLPYFHVTHKLIELRRQI